MQDTGGGVKDDEFGACCKFLLQLHEKMIYVIAPADRLLELNNYRPSGHPGEDRFHHSLRTIALDRMQIDRSRPDQRASAFFEYAPNGMLLKLPPSGQAPLVADHVPSRYKVFNGIY